MVKNHKNDILNKKLQNIEEFKICILSLQRFHYGIVTVSDGKCRPQTTRLKLSTDMLVLQREEFIFPDDDDGYPVDNKVKFITLIRPQITDLQKTEKTNFNTSKN